jgi:hypothetical protein
VLTSRSRRPHPGDHIVYIPRDPRPGERSRTGCVTEQLHSADWAGGRQVTAYRVTPTGATTTELVPDERVTSIITAREARWAAETAPAARPKGAAHARA